MRVALITPEYPGCGPSFGVGSYVQRLARELTGAGHGVCVAVVAHEGCWLGHSDHVHRVAHGRIPGVVRAWWTRDWLLRTLGDLAPDVVEIPNWGGLGAFVPRHWPLVVRLSTSIAHQRSRDRLRRHLHPFHLRYERATVRRAHLLVANSHAIAAACAPLYGRMADLVIPHAFPDPPRAGTQPPGGDVLFVGRLEHRKGIDVLLRAWPALRRAHPGRVLHVVGDDPGRIARRLQLDGVAFHGRLADEAVAALRQRCGVQVVPSRFESFGLTVVEAFAAGQAVVAGGCAGLSETVGPAGLTYAVEDHAALAASLARVLGDDVLRARLVALGRERLRERYSLAGWREATLAAYATARVRARATF